MDKKEESIKEELRYVPIVRGENEAEYKESQEVVFDVICLVLKIDEAAYDMGQEYLINNNVPIAILWKLFNYLKEDFSIVIENQYIDRTYRDSYYFHYSGKHFSYGRYCRRINVFEGVFGENDFPDLADQELQERFIGSIVIRPIPGREIGRTLLNPRKFIDREEYYVRLAKYSMTIYGRQLEVYAFPYSMQDGETTSCAETTILNISDYYSNTYQEYFSVLPSDINRIVESFSYERRMPTTGLTYQQISRIFTEIGFYPRLYSVDKMPANKFRHLLHYYIESGIPIGIGLKVSNEKKHSIVGIGHGFIQKKNLLQTVYAIYNKGYNGSGRKVLWVSDVADAVEEYCVIDDNKEPYAFYRVKEEKVNINLTQRNVLKIGDYQADYLMVPLYKRMYLEAADAYDICTSILANSEEGIVRSLNEDFPDSLQGLVSNEFGTKDDPVVIRLFMASSRTMHRLRHKQFQEICVGLRNIYDEISFPKFIWICEIYSVHSYQQRLAIGEIIIDATSSADAKDDSYIMIHYPGQVCRRCPDYLSKKDANSQFEKIFDWKPFPSYNGNLNSPQMVDEKMKAVCYEH